MDIINFRKQLVKIVLAHFCVIYAVARAGNTLKPYARYHFVYRFYYLRFAVTVCVSAERYAPEVIFYISLYLRRVYCHRLTVLLRTHRKSVCGNADNSRTEHTKQFFHLHFAFPRFKIIISSVIGVSSFQIITLNSVTFSPISLCITA